MRLYANNVRLRLAPVYVPIHEHATSARLEVIAALERLHAAGKSVVSNIEIVREVQAVAPDWSYDAIAKAVQRELARYDHAAGGPMLTRSGHGKYSIIGGK